MDAGLGLSLSPLAAVYGAYILGLISPGPDFFLVTTLALGRGSKAALPAAAGIALGVGLWVVAAAAGLATLIQSSPDVWQAVRLSGGGLLIYLGARALSAAIRDVQTDHGDQTGGKTGPFFLGLATNLANPKAAIVLVGLTALLAEEEPGEVPLFILVLGMPLLAWAWFSLLATILSDHAIRDRLIAYRRGLEAAMGAALCGVGILLIQTAQ